MSEMYTTELFIPGQLDTLRLLDATDHRIAVPLWWWQYRQYIPHGIKRELIPRWEGWLHVERNAAAEAIGEHAVRLYFLDLGYYEGQEAPEEPFGVLKKRWFGNCAGDEAIPTELTHGIILDGDGNSNEWRAILTTEVELEPEPDGLDVYAFSAMLGKLSGSIHSRYARGTL